MTRSLSLLVRTRIFVWACPERSLQGVYSGMKFLSQVNRGEPARIGQNVMVTGGGNVAIDCARVALRLGAKVTILYRREKKDMPALKEEISEAEHEGINFVFLGSPVKVLAKDGKVNGIEVEKMRLGEFDRSGRRSPESTGEFLTLPCDTVITAIGGNPDSDFLTKTGIKVAKNGTVPVNQFSLQTTAPAVFAGGDVVTGPWTVSDAHGAWQEVRSSHRHPIDGQEQISRVSRKPSATRWR